MLKDGMVFRNYRDLCRKIGWTIKSGGSSQKAQYKTLDALCKWHREGNKIIITEVFDTPKKRIDGRSKPRTKKEREFRVIKIECENYKKSVEILKLYNLI